MIHGMHHVALSTPNLERLSGFYIDILGFEKVDWQGGWGRGSEVIDRIVGLKGSAARQVMLRAGNLYVEVFEYLSPEPKRNESDPRACDHGYTHFALDVSDIEAEYRRLSAAGMRFNSPPVFDHEQGLAGTYGRDPDGNLIEIQEVLNRNHPFHASRSTTTRS
jgi:glyoxylase I family protein